MLSPSFCHQLQAPHAARSAPPSTGAVSILALAVSQCRQEPGSLASCQQGPACQKHHLTAQGGIALLQDQLVTRGSPLAQHTWVRRFAGGAGAWVSSLRSHGIASRGFEWHRSRWKPSSLLDWSSWAGAGTSFPLSHALPSSPALALGALPVRHGWRDAGMEGCGLDSYSLHPIVFSPLNFRSLWPSLAAPGRRETSLY